MLSPETRSKSMISAATDCEGQGSFVCSGVNDCRLTVENEKHGGFCNYSPSSLNRKTLKKTLKNYDRDAKVYFFPVDGFW